jgi:hypothetical protein
MFERLVRYVATASDNQLSLLKLQDMALCALWRGTPEADSQNALAEKLDAAMKRWLHSTPLPVTHTEGRRHQTLLRMAVDFLDHPAQDAMPPDFARLLLAAVTLGAPTAHATRLYALVQPAIPRLEALAGQEGPGAPLQQLRGRVVYAFPDELAKAPVQRIASYRGIRIDQRGPLFRAANHVRLLGDLPHDCLLIVEHGGCNIDGYLLGTLMCAGDCEVRENIGGKLAVSEGNVRCRGIIDRAWVSAKAGNVHCSHAHAPERVSAAGIIRVTGEVLRGSYYAQCLIAGGEVRGAHAEVTRLLEAPVLGAHRDQWLEIVLRRELSCEDYGQLLSGDVRQAVAETYRRRQAAHDYASMAAAAALEAERFAESALMFLFGGGIGQRRLDDLLAMQRRLNVLDRIDRNLQRLLDQAEERLLRGDAATVFPEEEIAPEDEAEDPEDSPEWDTLKQLDEEVHAARDRGHLWRILMDLRRNREQVGKQRARLILEVQSKEQELLATGPFNDLRSATDKGAAKLHILQRVLPMLQKQTQGPLADRLRAPFLARTLAAIDRRLARASRYEGLATRATLVFRELAEELRRAHSVQVSDYDQTHSDGARVHGRFDGGVHLFLDFYTADGTTRPPGSRIELEAPESEPRTISLEAPPPTPDL